MYSPLSHGFYHPEPVELKTPIKPEPLSETSNSGDATPSLAEPKQFYGGCEVRFPYAKPYAVQRPFMSKVRRGLLVHLQLQHVAT